MKKKVREAVIPKGREETVRQNIVSVLRGQTLSAREISGEVHVSEKEVLNNLLYIQKTLAKDKNHLIIIPEIGTVCTHAPLDPICSAQRLNSTVGTSYNITHPYSYLLLLLLYTIMMLVSTHSAITASPKNYNLTLL